jgi:outer membrane autotransporter protein
LNYKIKRVDFFRLSASLDLLFVRIIIAPSRGRVPVVFFFLRKFRGIISDAGHNAGGYDFGFLTPETGIRYQNIRNGYYTESSGISKNKNTNDILTGLLSLKIEKEFQIIQGLALAPQAKASVLYDITQADQYFNGFYEGTLTSFHQKTGSRLATEFQLGINFATSFGMNAFIGYNGVFRGARKNHGFSMTFSYEI